MIKLLIVEDEPLVQIGIRSMLNWSELGIEICQIAKDGIQGLEYMEKYSPELVITDIKMPRMDGLTMMKTARERFGKLPAFIVLTSYEEFQMLKEAMSYQIIDYLIKIELNSSDLTKTVMKALAVIVEIKRKENKDIPQNFSVNQSFYDKFFIKLLLNLFESEKQQRLQANELKIELNADYYVVSHSEIIEYTPMFHSGEHERLLNLYSSTVQMIREVVKKYIPCYVVSLDTKRFSIIFCLTKSQEAGYKELITDILEKTYTVIHNYFNVSIPTGVGRPSKNKLNIYEAYQDARQIFANVTKEALILFLEDLPSSKHSKNVFNMSIFRDEIMKAFEEYDTDTLSLVFDQITGIFAAHPTYYLQSMDAASNILYLAISLLPKGEDTLSEIFKNEIHGYRSLYKKSNVNQVIQWLTLLRDGLCQALLEERKDYKNHMVTNVKKYIETHIDEKLTLNDISAVFGISPNYLSQLFKKYNDTGYNDYITQKKITKAKHLMNDGSLKLYEIADKLGFENSFYFSKVFKKVEGCSPRDYVQGRTK